MRIRKTCLVFYKIPSNFFFIQPTGLHAIELAHNPWNCDCKLRPLKHWLDDQNVPHEVDPTCSTPSRIGTRSFTKLKLEEFACPPELLLAPRYVEATAGMTRNRKFCDVFSC